MAIYYPCISYFLIFFETFFEILQKLIIKNCLLCGNENKY